MPKDLLIRVSRRLFVALFVMFVITIGTAFLQHRALPTLVIATGIIGGFVGLQRRLKDLTVNDLELIADSWIYTCLSPLVGGILALLLYLIFLSGFLSGQLFPNFVPETGSGGGLPGFESVFQQHAQGYQDYAKLVVWSFVAGFSERFVTDVISRFEGTAVKDIK